MVLSHASEKQFTVTVTHITKMRMATFTRGTRHGTTALNRSDGVVDT